MMHHAWQWLWWRPMCVGHSTSLTTDMRVVLLMRVCVRCHDRWWGCTILCCTTPSAALLPAAEDAAFHRDIRTGDWLPQALVSIFTGPAVSRALRLLQVQVLPSVKKVLTLDSGLQAALRGATRNPEAMVLPYVLYSDATHVTDGGRKIHPLLLYQCLPLPLLRSRHAFERLAMLPVLDAAQVR